MPERYNAYRHGGRIGPGGAGACRRASDVGPVPEPVAPDPQLTARSDRPARRDDRSGRTYHRGPPGLAHARSCATPTRVSSDRSDGSVCILGEDTTNRPQAVLVSHRGGNAVCVRLPASREPAGSLTIGQGYRLDAARSSPGLAEPLLGGVGAEEQVGDAQRMPGVRRPWPATSAAQGASASTVDQHVDRATGDDHGLRRGLLGEHVARLDARFVVGNAGRQACVARRRVASARGTPVT